MKYWRIEYRSEPYLAKTHYLWVKTSDSFNQNDIERTAYQQKEHSPRIDKIDRVTLWDSPIEEAEYEWLDETPQEMKQEGEGVVKYLEDRIEQLNEADKHFCKLRWDMSVDSHLRLLAREESNKVTFARQELQEVLKVAQHPAAHPSTIQQEGQEEETFLQQLRRLSVERAKEGFKTYENQPITYWTTAIIGEFGELCNMIKKMKRAENGGHDSGHSYTAKSITPKMIREEIGGTLIYIDLLCSFLEIDLEEAITETFNEKSIELGFPYLLKPTSLQSQIQSLKEENERLRGELNQFKK